MGFVIHLFCYFFDKGEGYPCRVHVKLIDKKKKKKGWLRGFFVFSQHCKCQIWGFLWHFFLSLSLFPFPFTLWQNFPWGFQLNHKVNLQFFKTSLHFQKKLSNFYINFKLKILVKLWKIPSNFTSFKLTLLGLFI